MAKITNIEQAKAYIERLVAEGKDFHFDDDPHEVIDYGKRDVWMKWLLLIGEITNAQSVTFYIYKRSNSVRSASAMVTAIPAEACVPTATPFYNVRLIIYAIF